MRSRLVVLCAVAATFMLALHALAGCAPGLAPLPEPTTPTGLTSAAPGPVRTSPFAPPVPAIPPLSASPSTGGFPEDSAVTCAGRPGTEQVVTLLRAKHIIDTAAAVTARLGPLCAGTWQYTVLSVVNREPLQVITQGPVTALVLVTAGTDVCTAGVRAQAPPGIVAAAHCGQ